VGNYFVSGKLTLPTLTNGLRSIAVKTRDKVRLKTSSVAHEHEPRDFRQYAADRRRHYGQESRTGTGYYDAGSGKIYVSATASTLVFVAHDDTTAAKIVSGLKDYDVSSTVSALSAGHPACPSASPPRMSMPGLRRSPSR
jgi:hypothetical protein